jgi:hypothetical protein
LNNKEKMIMLGSLGEKIVRHLAQKEGCLVEESLSMYDSQKDLRINGKSCEVKTQTRFFVENAFTVKYNQVQKCTDVELLFFVETPEKGDTITVFECPKEKRKWRTRTTKDGRKMYLLDIDDMNVAYTLSSQQIANEMRQNSNSKW